MTRSSHHKSKLSHHVLITGPIRAHTFIQLNRCNGIAVNLQSLYVIIFFLFVISFHFDCMSTW